MAEITENNNNNDTSTRECRSKLESFLSTVTADTMLSLGGQIKIILPEEVLTGTRTTMPRALSKKPRVPHSARKVRDHKKSLVDTIVQWMHLPDFPTRMSDEVLRSDETWTNLGELALPHLTREMLIRGLEPVPNLETCRDRLFPEGCDESSAPLLMADMTDEDFEDGNVGEFYFVREERERAAQLLSSKTLSWNEAVQAVGTNFGMSPDDAGVFATGMDCQSLASALGVKKVLPDSAPVLRPRVQEHLVKAVKMKFIKAGMAAAKAGDMAVVFVERNSLAKVEAYLTTQGGLQPRNSDAVVTVPGGGMVVATDEMVARLDSMYGYGLLKARQMVDILNREELDRLQANVREEDAVRRDWDIVRCVMQTTDFDLIMARDWVKHMTAEDKNYTRAQWLKQAVSKAEGDQERQQQGLKRKADQDQSGPDLSGTVPAVAGALPIELTACLTAMGKSITVLTGAMSTNYQKTAKKEESTESRWRNLVGSTSDWCYGPEELDCTEENHKEQVRANLHAQLRVLFDRPECQQSPYSNAVKEGEKAVKGMAWKAWIADRMSRKESENEARRAEYALVAAQSQELKKAMKIRQKTVENVHGHWLGGRVDYAAALWSAMEDGAEAGPEELEARNFEKSVRKDINELQLINKRAAMDPAKGLGVGIGAIRGLQHPSAGGGEDVMTAAQWQALYGGGAPITPVDRQRGGDRDRRPDGIKMPMVDGAKWGMPGVKVPRPGVAMTARSGTDLSRPIPTDAFPGLCGLCEQPGHKGVNCTVAVITVKGEKRASARHMYRQGYFRADGSDAKP